MLRGGRRLAALPRVHPAGRRPDRTQTGGQRQWRAGQHTATVASRGERRAEYLYHAARAAARAACRTPAAHAGATALRAALVAAAGASTDPGRPRRLGRHPRPPHHRAGLLWRGRFGGRELRHARPPADATHAARALALALRRRAPAGAGILGRGLLGPLPLRLVLRPRATPLGPALDCAARRLHAALLRGRLPDPARFGQRTACGARLVRRLHPRPRHGCRDHVFAAGRGHRVGAPPPHVGRAGLVGPRRRLPPHGRRAVGADRHPPAVLACRLPCRPYSRTRSRRSFGAA
mmetsp:Transcript_15845/g.47736  ORF Transcript_15845/g.47736 Transcript_15845/m.47736 type:complete len:292 (+) Transcript_15845:301-1176(+)